MHGAIGEANSHSESPPPKFVRDRNPDGQWVIERFNQNILDLNELAGNLPTSLPWRWRTVEQFKAEIEQLDDLHGWRLWWQDMLDQVQAFGLLSALRLIELVSSAVWALRRDDPLCAAMMARTALETSANYAWFQTKVRGGIESIVDDVMRDTMLYVPRQLEDEILKTLWASRLEDDKAFHPTNVKTIIENITNKIQYQGEMKQYYDMLCEVVHPNMLGRSIFLSEEGGRTFISRKRGPYAANIEHACLFALSWAAATLPRSPTPMQATCVRAMQNLDGLIANVG